MRILPLLAPAALRLARRRLRRAGGTRPAAWAARVSLVTLTSVLVLAGPGRRRR